MAKVILEPIGTAVSLEKQEFVHEQEKLLDQKRLDIKQGWGEKYQSRVQAKNKLTTWERLKLLADPAPIKTSPLAPLQQLERGMMEGEIKLGFHSDIPLSTGWRGVRGEVFPIGTFVKTGGEDKDAPAAGVITALIKIENRWCMVIANDNTVASGSWWPKTPEKIIRAQEIALKLKLPVIYLVDCSGLYLPEQSKTFPGQYGAGKIFKMNSLLSNAGVPQIAGVFGDCIAGGGYMPIISDKVYMTEQAYMVIAGAALIQGAKSQNLSSLDIGGPSVHVNISNCADFRVPDDPTCLMRIREEISRCCSSAISYYQNDTQPSKPALSPEELGDLMLPIYDIKQIIARLIDDSLFWELFPNTGHEVVTGIAKINGLYVGISANAQGLLPHPRDPEQKRPGGILYKEGVAKLAMFSRACDADGIPLIWLQDVSGFDVGLEAEKQGLLGYGSSLIYANSTSQTPLITVLLRKASGAGYYAMAGLPYDPVLQLSTCLSRLAVMEGKTLAMGAFKTRPNETDPMRELAERIEADMDPFKSAGQMDTDEVIKFSEIRSYLECIVECCYQAQNNRRIKNPRIWSMHDFGVLNSPPLEKGGRGDFQSKADANPKSPLTPLFQRGEIIKAPLDGLFYLRASPKDPPFVHVGSILKPGDTIGLIEVMKCFHPLKYEGPSPKTVKEILVQENSPIKTGDGILLLE